MPVLTIAGSKGGPGKTTVAAKLFPPQLGTDPTMNAGSHLIGSVAGLARRNDDVLQLRRHRTS